uniref:Uncharacterized protein n=1 Tax=Strigamia maritima TaxID=126957 RepID=T1J6N8_STRMM
MSFKARKEMQPSEVAEIKKTEEELEIEELQKLIADGDPEELANAAITMQSNFRNFKARKNMKDKTDANSTNVESTEIETSSLEPKSEMDLINQEVNKLKNEFKEIKEKKQDTIIFQFADTDDNCFKELAEIEQKSVNPSDYTVGEDGDVLPESMDNTSQIDNGKDKNGRKSAELINMAEELVDNVIEEAVRASSAMSLKNETIASEEEDNVENQETMSIQSDTPISDIIEIVVEVMDYLMETIGMEFDQSTENQNEGTVERVKDQISVVVSNANIDPEILSTLEDLLDKVVEMDKTRNIYPDYGKSIEVAFADSAEALQQFSAEDTAKDSQENVNDRLENSTANGKLSLIQEENEITSRITLNVDKIEGPEKDLQKIDKSITNEDVIDSVEIDKEIESIILESDENDPSIVGLEEIVAAPPNSPAQLIPLEELESERLVSPDSLDPVSASRIDSMYTPDSLAEPILRDPLFTPDSISDPTETQ